MFKISEKLKRMVALIVALMLIVLLASSAVIYYTGSADERSDLESKQQNLSDNKEKIQSEIDGLNTEKKTLMQEKQALDEQVSVLEGEIEEINAEISDYQVLIDEKTEELKATEKELERQYDGYKERIRVMYESGSTNYLDVLVSSKSIGDFFEKLDIVSQIAEYDKKIIETLRAKQEQIETDKAELEEMKNELENKKSKIVENKKALDEKMNQRDKMIQKIQNSKDALEKQLTEIEAQEAAVRAQIAQLSRKNSGTAYSGGTMVWPTPSCRVVTSEFGMRFHPVLKYNKLHTGFDIGAGYGAKIVASASGEVITATYNSAYGNYVVIDHGGGVCTLYAHQSSMAVSVGQKVTAGQTIGYVGSTGYSTGPHLHFEVIVNGVVQDPRNYL